MDTILLLSFFLILVSLYFAANDLLYFVSLCIAIEASVLASAFVLGGNPGWDQWIIALLGTTFLIIGLMFVHTFVKRSISLDLLRCVKAGVSWKTPIEKGINGRTSEIVASGLGSENDGKIYLTIPGRFMADLIFILSYLRGLEK